MKRFLPFFTILVASFLLQAITPDVLERIETGMRLTGKALQANVLIFGTKDFIASEDCLEARSLYHSKSGFYRMNQNWDTAKIRQIEFTLKSDKPGYFRFAGNLEKDGVRKHFAYTSFSIIPDGQYRTYIADYSNDSDWEGILTNWELVWQGPEGAEIGLKMVDANGVTNQIPNASDYASAAPGELSAPFLRSRAKCRLYWLGSACPGVTLHFLDFNLKEIPGNQVTLPADGSSIDFETPETMILTKVEVHGVSDGYPVLEQLDYTPMFEPQGKWRGNWLWFQKEEGPNYYNGWFAREFDLDEEPDYASIAFLADDVAYVYVNHVFCGNNEIWQIPVRSDITHALKKGHNEIKIRVYNGEQAAGIAADVYVSAGGREFYFDTDDSWRCESKLNQPHTIPKVVDEPVVVLGNPHHTSPWSNGIGYRYAGPRGMLEATKIAPGKITAVVRTLPPVTVNSLTFTLKAKDGADRHNQFAISPSSNHWKVGEEITIEYPIPPIEKGDYELFLDDDFVGLKGNPRLAEISASAKPVPKIRQAKFIGGARPYVQLEDKRLNPVFWHSVVTIRSKRFFEFQLAKTCGTNNFRLAAEIEKFWKGENEYDFSEFDEAADLLFAAQPDAYFSVHVYAQMPGWWLDANPDEVATFQDGSRTGADQYKQSLASQKWLQDAEKPLRAFIKHLKTKSYADRIWGITIAENHNGEWFWDCIDSKRQYSWGGYNKCDLDFFLKILHEKYPSDEALAEAWHQPGMAFGKIATLPDWNLAFQGRLGTLMDPTQDQMLMDWLESRNLALSRALCRFGRIVKDATDGKWLFGAYFGYWGELACNNYRALLLTGHNGLWDVIKSPDVDFVGAPSRYNNRQTGYADGIMQPWSSFNNHGKVIYNEMDYRTAYNRLPEADAMRFYVGEPSTAYETAGHFNRAFGMSLTCGITGWLYSLSLGSLYEKALLDIFAEQARVYDSLPPIAGTTPCQVVVVGDTASSYYEKAPAADCAFTNALQNFYNEMPRLGLPYDFALLNDLLDNETPYPARKLYIMLPTLVLTHEQRTALMERFERESATVIWLYAAGPFYPGCPADDKANCDFLDISTTLSTEQSRPALTTIPEYGAIYCQNPATSAPWFLPTGGYDKVLGADTNGKPMLVQKSIGHSTHIYTPLMALSPEIYGQICAKAGIRRYVKGYTDQVRVGNDVLFIYTVTGGHKTLNLPEGYQAKAIIGPFNGTLPHNGTFEALPAQAYGFLVTPEE